MPIQYVGNATTKAARARSGGGVESAIEVATELSGGNAALGFSVSGGTISITTDGTFNFGTKPTGPKPLFVWRADDGIEPNANLGRLSAWSGGTPSAVNATISSTIVAPGSTQSATIDHSETGGELLSFVRYTTGQFYNFRRNYNEFIEENAGIIRTRIGKAGLTGTFQVGETVTGQTSGVTGVISRVEDDGPSRIALYYELGQGTVSTSGYLSGQDFVYQEIMVGGTSGASGTNVDGSQSSPNGILRDFNNKILRAWDISRNHDILIGEGTGAKVTPELTGSSLNQVDWDNQSVGDPTSFEWEHDEYLLKDGTINTQDGIFWRYRNGIKAYENDRFIMKDDSRPSPYQDIYQHQVSNGAQPGTSRYMDLLYIDEDWCRVVLMDGPDLRLNLNDGAAIPRKVMPCPIISWSSIAIDCHDWRQYLPTATHIGVINLNNELVGSVAL